MSISFAPATVRSPRGTGAPSATTSLFRRWVDSPAQVLRTLDSHAFSLAEAATMERWAAAQEPWGLSLRLRRDLSGAARLAEITGPDGCAPLALLYHGDCGALHLDDYSGEVRVCASVEEAQDLVLECL